MTDIPEQAVKAGLKAAYKLDGSSPMREVVRAILEAAMPHIREEWEADGSDGYHTFTELYEYRMLYNAHAANDVWGTPAQFNQTAPF